MSSSSLLLAADVVAADAGVVDDAGAGVEVGFAAVAGIVVAGTPVVGTGGTWTASATQRTFDANH